MLSIAVVDTGVDLDHPRFKKAFNKKVYDVLEEDHFADDDNGHGFTHVAWNYASETEDNREGVAGVTWYNEVMPI